MSVTSFTFKISGVAAYTDGTSGPFETTYSNGVISSPFESESNINFSQLYTDESDVVDSLQELLTLGSPDGKYLNFIVSAPVIDKTISDWWMDISGIVTYDDETSGYYCVQYRNGSFNDLDGKTNFYALLADPVASGAITDALQSVSSVSEVAVLNSSPTDILLSSATIAENNLVGAVVGTLSTTDPDAGDTFTYTLVAGTGDTDNASFTIDGANLLADEVFSLAIKSSYTVRVRSTDQGGSTTEKAFSITVVVQSGSLWYWGRNSYELINPNSSPVQISLGGDTWKQASTGFISNFDIYGARDLAVKADGTMWAQGFFEGVVLEPVRIFDDMGSSWKQVSVDAFHAAAIKTDGTLWAWGLNYYGEIGDGTTEYRSSPVQTITGGSNWSQVACGRWGTAAIKTDGTLWAWGNNRSGSLGDDSTVDKSSPVQTISGGSDWVQVAACTDNMAAVKADGTLWTVGGNFSGQLGNNRASGGGSFRNRSSPVQTSLGGTNWKSVACGGADTIYYISMSAIKTDGTLWLWGNNNGGGLGDNTTENRSNPVQVMTAGNWKYSSTSGTSSAGIKSDGTLWTWGDNGYGQLGDNTTESKSSPVQTIMGGSSWLQVAMAENHTVAIKD